MQRVLNSLHTRTVKYSDPKFASSIVLACELDFWGIFANENLTHGLGCEGHFPEQIRVKGIDGSTLAPFIQAANYTSQRY
jgi:hypothetical protein